MQMQLLCRLLTGGILFCAAAGIQAGEITIGQVAPFSGPLAPTGIHIRAGAQLYIDRINASGGVHGARLKFVSRDDGYKAPETVRLAREVLRESQPLALLGVVGTGNVAALVKENVLGEAGIPLVGIRSGASSLIRPVNPYLFHTRASYAEEIDKIVQQLASIGYRRVAVFYQDDPFGLDGLASAEASLKKAGVELAVKASYEKNTTKVEQAVKAIVDARPQGVIMVSNTAASAEFVRQSRAAGNDGLLIALSVTDGPQVAKITGKEVAHGLGVVQVVPDPNDRALPLVRDLHEDFKRFQPQGVEINHTLLEGYVAARVLVEGLRRAGPAPTRKKLRDALETMRDYDAGGLFMAFSPASHSGSHYVDITILNRDGRILR